jgi:hypothetical protein
MKAYGEVEVQGLVFLTSALVGDELTSRSGCFNSSERSGVTLWLEGWVGSIADFNVAETRKTAFLSGIKLRPSNPSLYGA